VGNVRNSSTFTICYIDGIDMDGEPRAVALQVLKGGFGKSAIANTLTDRLAERGNRTLLMDLDPEGHLSTGLGYYERQNDDRPDYRDVVFEGADPQDIIESTEWGFDIVPALNLEAVNRDLSRDEVLRSDEQLKQHFVEPLLGDEYDYIVMDLAGSRNKLTNNAMVASRNIIIPLQPVAEALNGLRQTTTKMVGPLRQYMDVEILAVVPNRLSQRIDQDTTDRELLESMNTSERFAAYLEAGRNGVDVDAAELPDDRSAEAVIDDHVPEFARITADEWDMIDAGELNPPSVPIRERRAVTRAYRSREPLSEYDPDCDQLQYFDELAEIVENGGIQ